ncbi:MAG: hypothetical protein AABY22_22255 [Nanoarchaeota archaeon]
MSILHLVKSEFDHIPERSTYNHNYYLNKVDDYIILEDCDELSNTYEFYLVEPHMEVLLGSSLYQLHDDSITTTLSIDFKKQYT